ncbi:MAG: hypothetical protein ACI9J3_001460 [Parvicellaceae bacterium]|jgi:hypothetical protein
MKRRFILFFVITFNLWCLDSKAQFDCDWVYEFDKPWFDAGDIAHTKNGDLVMVGSFFDTVEIGGTIFFPELPFVENSIVIKFDTFGNVDWTYRPSGGEHINKDVEITESGDIIVLGYFTGSITFDSTYTTSLSASIGEDYLFKLDSLGNFKWSQHIITPETQGENICVDRYGNIHLFEFADISIQDSSALSGIYSPLAKIDSNGQPVWLYSTQINHNFFPSPITCLHSGRRFLIGEMMDTIEFGPSTLYMDSANGKLNYSLISFDSDDSELGAIQFSSALLTDVYLNCSENGKVILFGHYSDSLSCLGSLLVGGEFFSLTLDSNLNLISMMDIPELNDVEMGVNGILISADSMSIPLLVGLDSIGNILAIEHLTSLTLLEDIDHGVGNEVLSAGHFINNSDLCQSISLVNSGPNGFVGSFTFQNVLEVENQKNLGKINIFPNPSTGYFTIDYQSAVDIENLIVTDIVGNVVKSINLNSKEGRASLDLSNQNSGIYFCSLVYRPSFGDRSAQSSDSRKLASVKLVLTR